MNRVLLFVPLLFVDVISLADEPAKIGSRRELFVDDTLVERLTGRAQLQLHAPMPREVALETSETWEGNSTNYVTVFQDDDKYRMYYRGSHFSYLGGKDRPNTRDVYCYAESLDGVHWSKPALELFEWNGSKQNNIVWDGVGSHAFVPFRDTNPRCAADAKYKALGVGGKQHGLYAFQSADAIHWTLMHPEPVITTGAFDSQNVAFWDAERGEYATERTMQETGGVLRRYSLRIDGFVSLHAPLIGGELITKPLTFTGNQLTLNASTSAAGSVRVEIQDADGLPLPRFALTDCQEVYGDDLDRTVIWAGNPDPGSLVGKPVRIRFEVKDADLYSFQFRDGSR